MAKAATKEPTKAAKKPSTTKPPEGPWQGFKPGLWQKEVDVRDFIQVNYEPYEGAANFLAPATKRTKKIMDRLAKLYVEEWKKSVLDISPIPSSITAHAPGYIDKENEIIVGLQTEAPLRSEEHTSELQSLAYLVCRLLL